MTKRDETIEQFPVQKRQIRFEAEPEMIFFDVDEDPGEADFIRIDDLFQMESQAETLEENSAELPVQEDSLAQQDSPAETPEFVLEEQSAQTDSVAQLISQEETPEEILAIQPAQESIPVPVESQEKTPEIIPAEQPVRENQPFQQQSPAESPSDCARWFTLFPQKRGMYIDSRMSRLLRRTLLLTAYRLEKPIETIRIRPQFIQWLMVLSSEEDIQTLLREFRDALELQAQNLLTVRLKGLFLSDICIVQFDGKELGVNETIHAVNRYQENREKKGTQK